MAKIDKITGVLAEIFTPAIVIYLIATVFVILRLLFAYIIYGEFNLNLYDYSLLGMERCSPSWGGDACHPPLNDFRNFIEWNGITRLIFIVSVIWWVVLAGRAVLQKRNVGNM